jgi:hypothetical protein
MRTLLTLALALSLAACAGPSPSTAPSFDVGTPTAIHLDTLIVSNEGFFGAHNEIYAHIIVQAKLANADGSPLALHSTLPAEVVCRYTDDGLPVEADALGSPASCGWATYLEMPKGKRKGVYYTVTLNDLVGDGYLYDPSANEAPATVVLRLR